MLRASHHLLAYVSYPGTQPLHPDQVRQVEHAIAHRKSVARLAEYLQREVQLLLQYREDTESDRHSAS